jgi:hypothetical protein
MVVWPIRMKNAMKATRNACEVDDLDSLYPTAEDEDKNPTLSNGLLSTVNMMIEYIATREESTKGKK